MKKIPYRNEIFIVLLFVSIGLYPGHLFAASARASGRSTGDILGLASFFGRNRNSPESAWTVSQNDAVSPDNQVPTTPNQYPLPGLTESRTANEDFFTLNDQKNILIIGVKQGNQGLSSLEGVWLAIQVPSSPRILFIPVYPANTREISDQGAGTPLDLSALYGSRRQLSPPDEFLTALERAEIWWSYYLVVDQHIIKELNALAGSPSGNEPTWTQPDVYTTLEDQFLFALSVCQNLDDVLAHKERFAEYLLKMHGHYASDLEPIRLVDVFSSLFRYGDSLACEFPTLSLAAIK